MKVIHDFRCVSGHVTEQMIDSSVAEIPCPKCPNPARRVFLVAPRLDWLGMAQGDNAGPEFVDRFERIHKREADKELRHLERNGDYGPGKQPPAQESS